MGDTKWEDIFIFPKVKNDVPWIDFIVNLLWLTWVLQETLENALKAPSYVPHMRYPAKYLPTNEWVMQWEGLDNEMIAFKNTLNSIWEINWNKPPIVFINDDKCETNTWLIDTLSDVLWAEGMKKLVSSIPVDFKEEVKSDLLEKVHKNSMIIIWGSWMNVFKIHESWTDWEFADMIKWILSDHPDKNRNNYLWWICHWQSYLLRLLNLLHTDSRSIVLTNKWHAHYWPSHVKLENYYKFTQIEKEFLRCVTNNWQNLEFTCLSTRSWKNNFDIMETWIPPNLNILWRDVLTDDPVLWGLKNGRWFWFHLHPEGDMVNIEKINTVNQEKVFSHTKTDYWDRSTSIIKNAKLMNEAVKENIWKQFYTWIHAYCKLINKQLLENKKIENFEKVEYELEEDVEKIIKSSLLSIINERQLDENLYWLDDKDEKYKKKDYLRLLDTAKRLRLNSFMWRDVSRWIWEVSKEYWFKDITVLIKKIFEYSEKNKKINNNNVICDMWSGTWCFLEELDMHFKDYEKKVTVYGLADEVPLDLFVGMCNSEIAKKEKIPEIVLKCISILIAQKYNYWEEWLTYSKISKIITQLVAMIPHLSEFFQQKEVENNSNWTLPKYEYEFNYSLLFYQKVFRPDIRRIILTEEEFGYLENEDNYIILDRLLRDMQNDLFKYYKWTPQKIFATTFSNFKIYNPNIQKADIFIATKSTSHVNPREYSQIIIDFIEQYSKPWSIYIDNWVMQSYNSIPRLDELKKNHDKYKSSVDMVLIYDKKTNYYNWVIIAKKFENENGEFTSLLKESDIFNNSIFWKDAQLVSLHDAYRCIYTKWERYIREYLLTSFKSYEVFWNNKEEIAAFLKKIPELKKNKDRAEIKKNILILVNNTAEKLNKIIHDDNNLKIKMIRYNNINKEMLDRYESLLEKKKFDDIIDDLLNKEISIPDWYNIEWKRKFV